MTTAFSYKRSFTLVPLSRVTLNKADSNDIRRIISHVDNTAKKNVSFITKSSKEALDVNLNEVANIKIIEIEDEEINDLGEKLTFREDIESIFVIVSPNTSSKTEILELAFHPLCNHIIATKSYANDSNDNFPQLPSSLFHEIASLRLDLKILIKVNREEEQYLDLVRKIISEGVRKSTRTGIDSLAIFGNVMRFSLKDGRIPVLTTKKVFWRAVVEELLWFLRGETSSQILSRKNIGIWDGNGTREFLESRGLGHREEGDLGPIYGFQWRHFGARYVDCHTDYEGQGVDQIQEIIHTLKTDPSSRRMVLTAWNPTCLHEMALPPCHVMSIFNVLDGRLNCMVTQRSADVGLGVPFNIASYALLVYILSHVTGIPPGDLVYTTADTHIYENHIDALKIQVQRIPEQFPCVRINTEPTTKIEDIRMKDIKLTDYLCHEAIPMPMSI